MVLRITAYELTWQASFSDKSLGFLPRTSCRGHAVYVGMTCFSCFYHGVSQIWQSTIFILTGGKAYGSLSMTVYAGSVWFMLTARSWLKWWDSAPVTSHWCIHLWWGTIEFWNFTLWNAVSAGLVADWVWSRYIAFYADISEPTVPARFIEYSSVQKTLYRFVKLHMSSHRVAPGFHKGCMIWAKPVSQVSK